MIAIIRIRGQVDIDRDVEETLNRLRIRKKYACVVIREKPEYLGMLHKVENFVAYGNIDKETFKELVEKRGQPIKKLLKGKIDNEKIVKEFFEGKSEKSWEEFGIKPFFRLHPARGGIKTKLHYPKGVLGNNKLDINKLIMRML